MTCKELENYLMTMAKSGRIANSILIDGVRSEEDRKSAEAFVRELMGSVDHADVIRIEHEKENVISVKEIREQVCDNVMLRPFAKPYKIYFIEMDLLNPQGQNALLKTLEEPPQYAIFIMFTRAADMLLETIRSRCLVLTLGESAGSGDVLPETRAAIAAAAQSLLDAGPADASVIFKELVSINEAHQATFDEIFAIIVRTYCDMLIGSERQGSRYSRKFLLAAADAAGEAGARLRAGVNKNLALNEMANRIRSNSCQR